MFSFGKMTGAMVCALALAACVHQPAAAPKPAHNYMAEGVYPSMSTLANYISGDQVQVYSLDAAPRASFAPGFRDDMSQQRFGTPAQTDSAVMVFSLDDPMPAPMPGAGMPMPMPPPSAPVDTASFPPMMPPSAIQRDYLSPFPGWVSQPPPAPEARHQPTLTSYEQFEVRLPDFMKPLPRGYTR